MLQGCRVHYIPGWDCHGLPIEIKAVAEATEQGQHSLSAPEIRDVARGVALRELERQRSAFQDFGIMADWSDDCTYRTMSFPYELDQLRLFARCVERGLVYEQFRPVYWSPSTQTALAEAEIEYDEAHTSCSVYVRFRLLPSPVLAAQLPSAIDMIVWTTTPWSLLGNMALVVNSDASYSVVRRDASGELFLVATDLVDALAEVELGRIDPNGAPRERVGHLTELTRLTGADLVGARYDFLLTPSGASRAIMAGAFVTTTSGTGIVHSAPAHGQEDYMLWRDSGQLAAHGIISPIDAAGRLVVDEPRGQPAVQAPIAALHGAFALGDGTERMIALLDAHGALLGELPYMHSYPIDWRTKQPILTRATAQWFADLTHIHKDAQAALKDVHFVPSAGRQRLESLVLRRSEWCISRQRAWGVPIPVVYNATTDVPLITCRNVEHIIGVLERHGSTDAWWSLEPDDFVAPEYRASGVAWKIKGDTLDVWFDSGVSWAILQRARGIDPCSPAPCADVYLEGSDQHRGWFQSSLLTRISSCGPGTPAPYAHLLTHGFVVDETGRKMSKSLGNVISPHTFLLGDGKLKGEFPAYGADVLRWWAAKTDYTRDTPISALIMKHVSDEVRKLRNTARFMLGNVTGYARGTLPPLSTLQLSLADQAVLHEVHALERHCRAAYDAFDFTSVTRYLNEFATKTLSSIYLDITKDTLYAGAESDRLPVVAVLDEALHTMTCALAPILPHLAEEIAWYRSGATSDPTPEEAAQVPSFFQQGWHTVDDIWHRPHVAQTMRRILDVRSDVYALLVQCRKEKLLKSAPEAAVELVVGDSELRTAMEAHVDELPNLLTVAEVRVMAEQAPEPDAPWLRAATTPLLTVRVRPAPLNKCPRCWRYHAPAPDTLCHRCKQVVSCA